MAKYTYRDANWNLDADTFDYGRAQLGMLMDIRDELRLLNRLLHCENFVAIPRKLDRISINTQKPSKKKRAAT